MLVANYDWPVTVRLRLRDLLRIATIVLIPLLYHLDRRPISE